MKWTGIPLLALILVADVSAAQTAAGPRVLSTVPDPPAGASAVPAQMSGLPLQVGDLPPGIVATRVIRRTFEQNVAGQVVQLRSGSNGRVVEATTGTDGRAQFPALAVGDIVRVRTAIDGETLESQPFPIPAEGGVRLVLVSGVGAGAAVSDPWPASAATAGAAGGLALSAVTTVATTKAAQSPGYTYVAASAVLSVLGAAAILWPRGRRSRKPAGPEGQSEIFERLVQMEKDFEAGRIPSADHEARREALIQQLLAS